MFYFSLGEAKEKLNFSFFISVLLYALFSYQPAASGFFGFAPLALVFISFYLVAGIGFEWKDPQGQRIAYLFLNNLLFFTAFLFVSRSAVVSWVLLLFIGLLNYFLVRESFRWGASDTRGFPRRERFLALAVSFLSLQSFAVLLFLPIGFINIAIASAIFTSLLRDAVIDYLRGDWTRREILKKAILYLALFAAVMAVSRWRV